MKLPLVTAGLPGAGGAARMVPEDFEVEEVPAYLPSGEGEHAYLWIEKRGIETRDVVRAVARALAVSEDAVGVAGQKDRQAVTRQWLSVHGAGLAAGFEGEGFRVLSASRHGNKLRVGHLRGNRFLIRLRGVPAGGGERARALAGALGERGLANFYGAQRFGRAGDNAELGRRLLLGERVARDRFTAKLYASAFQSEVFNRVLAARLEDGSFATALEGDVLEKRENGAKFICEDPAADAPRVASFEVSPTGPMPGPRMRPVPRGRPATIEAEALAATGVGMDALSRTRLTEGARRALRVPVAIEVTEEPPDALVLAFDLPAGSYATVVIDEIAR